MAQLLWDKAVGELYRVTLKLQQMWPAVAFRIAGVLRKEGDENVLAVAGANFQAVPVDRVYGVNVTLPNPHVLEGALPMPDFLGLLERWLEHSPASVGEWILLPPEGIQTLDWSENMEADLLWDPLIDPLPQAASQYRVHRLVGGGGQLPAGMDGQLRDQLGRLRTAPQGWAREYLGISTWDTNQNYMLVCLPIAVHVAGFYDSDASTVYVQLHYRPPYVVDEFWARIGRGRWELSLPEHRFSTAGRDEDGWELAEFATAEAADGPLKVWVGRGAGSFDWQISIHTKRSLDPASLRESFLSVWYELTNQQLAPYLQKPSPSPRKGETTAAGFETALANACSALGYSVVFGGNILKTRGCDFVAFDADSSQAYAVSATLEGNVGDKLDQWLLVEPSIRKAFQGVWRMKPIIVTAQPTSSIRQSHLRDCADKGVLVLGEDELRSLSESPPDLDQFRRALNRSPILFPSAPPTPGL